MPGEGSRPREGWSWAEDPGPERAGHLQSLHVDLASRLVGAQWGGERSGRAAASEEPWKVQRKSQGKARWGAVGMDRGGLTGVLTGKAGAWGCDQSSWGPWLAALPREAEGPGGRGGEIGFGQAGLDPPGRQPGEGPGGGGLRLRDEERCSGQKGGSRSPSGAAPLGPPLGKGGSRA